MNLVLLPVLIPLATAALCLLAWDRVAMQRVIGVIGAGLLFVSSIALLWTVQHEGTQVIAIGNWPAPFGIIFVADRLAAVMVVLAGLMGAAVAIYSLGDIDEGRQRFGYYPLYHFLLMGVCGAFLTGDLFNLYVWFEVLLIASFVLLALGGERGQIEGAFKYVALNLVSSLLFLGAVGLIYGSLGALNLAEVARRLAEEPQTGYMTALSMLFLVAFGIKAATFPLFFWLPASYHVPPAPVSAIFAGLLTKVGVYALIRVFTLIFVQDADFTHNLILIVAGLTMITGVLGAVAQNEFRRILSFHIVSQIGYMLMGLGLYTVFALAGAIFYIIHHIVAKTTLFLVSGVANRVGGSYELKRLGGLYRATPLIAVLFLIPAMALAGIPPFSGFFAKFMLIRAGVEQDAFLIVGVALLVSLMTIFSMTKIWAEAFWKPLPDADRAPQLAQIAGTPAVQVMILPIIILAAISAGIGFLAGPVADFALEASAELLDPTIYIEAVLGPGGAT